MACYLLLFITFIFGYIGFLALRSLFFTALRSFSPMMRFVATTVRSMFASLLDHLAPQVRALVVRVLNLRSEYLWRLSGYLMLGFTLAGFLFSFINGVHH